MAEEQTLQRVTASLNGQAHKLSPAEHQLVWLAERGAKFTLPDSRTKNVLPDGWPEHPRTLEEALVHSRGRNNTGILTGKHSQNIVAVDVDFNFEETVAMLGDYGKTTKIVRMNAIGRGKLLYRIKGELPGSTAWYGDPPSKHPKAEFLSNGKHAICPPSSFESGSYSLDTTYDILEISAAEAEYIWQRITNKPLYDVVVKASKPRPGKNDFREQVRSAWSTLEIFAHFDKDVDGVKNESQGQVRLLGNGGLLVRPDGVWYSFAEGIGGDEFEAWSWCTTGSNIAKDPQIFKDVMLEMADAVGIEPPAYLTRTRLNDDEIERYTVYKAEDGGILDAWLDMYSEQWLFVAGWDCWCEWTGTHWQKDESQLFQGQLQALMLKMNQAGRIKLAIAENEENKDEINIWKAFVNATKRTNGRVVSVESMAQTHRAVSAGKLNTGNVLNLANGTLDLNTLAMHPHTKADHLTYCLDYGYDPQAQATRFAQFLTEVLLKEIKSADDEVIGLETDEELCDLAEEMLGYCLTNETKHEAMFWLSGAGGNGKTVLITVIHWLLGDLAFSVDFQTIGQSGNYDLAEVAGKRVIFSTESRRGGQVAENILNQIVSGEKGINARPIYGSPFRFDSLAKVLWAMNDKPTIKDTGNAIWRRMKLFHFLRSFIGPDDLDPKDRAQAQGLEKGLIWMKDVNLLNELRAELPGILNIALAGLKRLYERGRFATVQSVTDAVREYKHDSNALMLWIEDRAVHASKPVTMQTPLYDDYCDWCWANGRTQMNSTNFGVELKKIVGKAGFKRSKTGMLYNLSLKTQTQRRIIPG